MASFKSARNSESGLVPYSVLGRGFLTGKMDKDTKLAKSDFRSMFPRFTPEVI